MTTALLVVNSALLLQKGRGKEEEKYKLCFPPHFLNAAMFTRSALPLTFILLAHFSSPPPSPLHFWFLSLLPSLSFSAPHPPPRLVFLVVSLSSSPLTHSMQSTRSEPLPTSPK
eukprot:753239-Hanusia_phi.AAC.1